MTPFPKLKNCLAFMAVLCCVLSGRAVASGEGLHPVSVTQAYAYVTRDAIDVKLEVFLEDLFLFHNLKPNDQDFLEPDIIQQGIELHKDFLLEKFVIRDLAGERLRGQMLEVQRQKGLPPEGVPLGELMAHKLVFRVRFVLPLPPEFLTVSQHFTGADGLVPAEMNLVVKQESAGEAHMATLKPDTPETVRFNWDTPPLSAEASEEERKKWEKKQKEETLGITSYSSVYSFLYIEDFEVRHEILIPLLTLEESILIARDDDEFLDIAEQDAARQQIEAYFASGNPIEIDGVYVKPKVDRCDFFGLDFKDFAKQAKRKRVSLASARVGIILSYSIESAPETLKLTWNRFNNFVWTINMIVFSFDEVSKATLSRLGSSNVYDWKNPGRPELPELEEVASNFALPPEWSLPVVSIGCLVLTPVIFLVLAFIGADPRRYWIVAAIGLCGAVVGVPFLHWKIPSPLYEAPELTDAETASVFAALHQNIYRAFDYRSEEDIYDALAKSIDGDLLQQVYLQIQHGLKMQEQGGAVSKIREVKLLDGEKQTGAAEGSAASTAKSFSYRGRWNVAGTVEHWGHIHARTNQYEALFEVEMRNDVWKITKLELLAEDRVSFETSLRAL